MTKVKTYFKMWCGHIQMHSIAGIKNGETRIYCTQCKDLRTVLKMSRSRFD